MSKKFPLYQSTTNACRLCRPLGAALAFRGIAGAVPFLHGSQGCATYMRRYIISHFNEPIDIASSSLGEKQAVYGGGPNLKLGLENVREKYQPELIGVASTCLTETIGDDLPGLLKEYRQEFLADDAKAPLLINVSTPSYSGSHSEGFWGTLRACVEQLVEVNPASPAGPSSPPNPVESAPAAEQTQELSPAPQKINLFPGMVSPADIRLLKELCAAFMLDATLLADYSDTLDGPALRDYPLIPAGGTDIAAIRSMASAVASIELASNLSPQLSPAAWLEMERGVSAHRMILPIGLRGSDSLMDLFTQISGNPLPESQRAWRGRLLDAMVDCHKYFFGKKVVVYGEDELVIGLTSFIAELGLHPVLCASGGKSGKLAEAIEKVCAGVLPADFTPPEVIEEADFFAIAEHARRLKPDLLLGHSKGYHLARELDIPLVRVGFPIHDRMGGQRILHLGYQGAQQLFDNIVNTIIAEKQQRSAVGYSYA